MISVKLPSCVDVAIIGGGVVGASINYWLARAGITAVMLEQTQPAYGATGRNGGFMSIGLAESYIAAIARFGHETARMVLTVTRESVTLLRQILSEEEIACEYCESGNLILALHEQDLSTLIREAKALQADGVSATLLDRSQLKEIFRKGDYHDQTRSNMRSPP